MIIAFAHVLNERKRSFLVLVGDPYDYKFEINELLKKYGIDTRVRVVGKVKNVIPIIKYFKVGVNCSESEGPSNVLIEYNDQERDNPWVVLGMI